MAELTYTRVGDYYIPDLILDEEQKNGSRMDGRKLEGNRWQTWSGGKIFIFLCRCIK